MGHLVEQLYIAIFSSVKIVFVIVSTFGCVHFKSTNRLEIEKSLN